MKKQSRDSNRAGKAPMSGTILVVEDDQGLSRLIQGHLERLNFHVERAISGAQAIEWLASNRVALALLDYGLPDMTGTELIKALAKNKCSVPFIMVTGRGDEALAVEMMKLGARDYMVKDTTFLDRLPIAVQRTFEQLATEQKLAEAVEELRGSEEKYRTVLDTMEEAYYEVDLAGNFTFFNDSLCRIIGYPRDELMGMNNRQYLDDETAKAVYEVFNGVYRTGEPDRAFGWEAIRKDGTRIFVESSISLMRGSSGEPVGFRGIIRDITERKQAEEALKASEEKLRVIFESITDGIIVSDLEGQIIDENEAAVRLQGYSDKVEVIGRDGFEFIAEKDRARATEDAMRSIEMGYGPAHEYTFVDKDGREYDAEASASLLRDSAGNTTGFISVFRDITERKQAEQELKASEEKLRAMFESITDGIVVTDLKGIILDVNDVVVQMSGLSREEIIGKDGFALIPREDRDKVVEGGKKIVRGETGPVRMEHEISPQVGSSQNTNLVLGTMHDSDGKPSGFVAIAQDFTERKKAEIALRESEAKYRDLVESISDVIYSVDANGATTYISPVVESVLGYTPSELTGSSFAGFMYQEDLKSATEGFMNTLSGNTKTGEFRVVTKSGEVRWVRSSNHPVFEEDRVIGVAGVMTDITERKRAEQEQERLLAELEDKSKELEQLLFISSHDLRSPLVNIQGFAKEMTLSLQEVHSVLDSEDIPSAVKEKLAVTIDKDIADSLNYILSSTSKIDTLLTGLLKVSRLGRATLNIEKLNMKELMTEVVDSYEFQTREAGVKLVVGRLPQCRGDRAQLNQVFSNLIGNALKYLDPERPGIIRISGRKEDNKTVYTVEDNGVGIAPEHQEAVFQIFQRVDPTATPGEGLGLTIVRRILERHGGKTWLESEPGRGSRFHVALPIRDWS